MRPLAFLALPFRFGNNVLMVTWCHVTEDFSMVPSLLMLIAILDSTLILPKNKHEFTVRTVFGITYPVGELLQDGRIRAGMSHRQIEELLGKQSKRVQIFNSDTLPDRLKGLEKKYYVVNQYSKGDRSMVYFYFAPNVLGESRLWFSSCYPLRD
jgi:hypothetical protein